MRILLNGLPTQVGGGATVWRALCAGSGAETLLLSRSEAASGFVSEGLPNVQVTMHEPSRLGAADEIAILRRAVAAFQPDVVITHNRTSPLPGIGVPQIALHVNLSRFTGRDGIGLRDRAGDLVRDELTKWSLRSADANVFESAHLLDAAKRRYPSVSIAAPSVAYVGVEETWTRSPDEPAALAGSDSRRLIAVTSPNPHKDNPQLINLLSKLRKDDPDWRLAIVGGRNISFWADLQEQAASAGVSDALDFLGFLSRDALATELDRSFALISPSLVESFAMVPLEAMARGLPAVVTDRPAMPESVGDNAIVVPAGDSTAMAGAVHRLTDPTVWQDYSRRGRQRASDLSWTAFANSILDVVESISR